MEIAPTQTSVARPPTARLPPRPAPPGRQPGWVPGTASIWENESGLSLPGSPCSRGDSLSTPLLPGKPRPAWGAARQRAADTLNRDSTQNPERDGVWKGNWRAEDTKDKRKRRCRRTRKERRGSEQVCERQPGAARAWREVSAPAPAAVDGGGGRGGSWFEFSRFPGRRGDPEGFVTAAQGSGRAGAWRGREAPPFPAPGPPFS